MRHQTYQTPLKSGQYVTWLNHHSVAVGNSIDDVERRAIAVFNSEDYQAYPPKSGTVLRITKGAQQAKVSERKLD